jgi:hypothetical protein
MVPTASDFISRFEERGNLITRHQVTDRPAQRHSPDTDRILIHDLLPTCKRASEAKRLCRPDEGVGIPGRAPRSASLCRDADLGLPFH